MIHVADAIVRECFSAKWIAEAVSYLQWRERFERLEGNPAHHTHSTQTHAQTSYAPPVPEPKSTYLKSLHSAR